MQKNERVTQPNPLNWKVVKRRLLKRAKELRPGHEFTRVDPRLREEGGFFDLAINRAIDNLIMAQPSKGKTIKQ